ncbi:hypothetical protein HL10_gp238 [Cronobacter phage CR8]|uniref:Uncharacterized protein n=2 Tax=Certrevirus TaxID=1914850 RepID=A0A060AMP2_9CAUD|nr:hypothetical protein HL10_gp238 [Cronobacter phage CR8]YP_009188938.1 hypothetical protein ADU18_0074 [Cronobacter phage PBES 02]AIA64768.1 hypothetical protein CR8_238 [Cronobacter phage CR8]AKY03977.1 hypothetical protein ADU18_0074 [Cronobacter phage PBES 02]
MRALIWGGVYVLFVIFVACLIPAVMIPVFQDFGLYARDVVGFTLTITLVAVLLLMAFGALIWSVLS